MNEPTPGATPSRRRKLVPLGLIVALVALVAGATLVAEDRNGSSEAVGAGPSQRERQGTAAAETTLTPTLKDSTIPSPPHDGSRYRYAVTGSVGDGSQTPFAPGLFQELTIEVEPTVVGAQVLSASADHNGQRSSTRSIWNTRGHFELSTEVVGMDGEHTACSNDPPVMVLRFPLKPGPLEAQTFAAGSCIRSSRVNVIATERAADASGRPHTVWKIEHLVEGLDRSIQSMKWFSPTLGVDVRRDQLIISQAGTTTRQQTVLVSISDG